LAELFEKLGAKFEGTWFAFGEGRYDLVAIVEVPAAVDVAALVIAAQASWPGKPFDNVSVTPLLSHQDGIAAWQRAARALATVGNASATAALIDSTMATPRPDRTTPRETVQTSKVEMSQSARYVAPERAARPAIPEPAAPPVDRVEVVDDGATTVLLDSAVQHDGSSDVQLPDEFDLLDDVRTANESPPPSQAVAQRRWRTTPVAAAAVTVTLAAAAAGGYFWLSGTSPSPPTPSPPPRPVAATVPAYLPAGAMACEPVYGDVRFPFDTGARGTATTSCPFVEQVRRAYAQLTSTSAPTDQIRAVSPSTGKWYDLACSPMGNYVTCTGGAAAVIYLYNTSR
jgi:hypothetical protein